MREWLCARTGWRVLLLPMIGDVEDLLLLLLLLLPLSPLVYWRCS